MDENEAYRRGIEDTFSSAGLEKKAARYVAEAVSGLKKKAGLFGSDDYDDSSFDWKSILIPAVALLAGGFVGYQARDKGYGDRSALNNIKNYVVGSARNLIRKGPRPIYDYKSLLYR